MAPTLWLTTFNPPVRCVLMSCAEIGIDLNLKQLDLMKGEQFSDEFKKINPLRTVPTLVDGDFILWDSHAIATFLINKYASDEKREQLYPTDIYQRARIDQRLHYASSTLFAVSRNIAEKIAYQGANKVPDDLRSKMINAYDIAETFLADDPYMCGEHLTVADFSITAGISSMVDTVQLDEEKHYKLGVYLEKIKKLPYYDEVNHKGVVAISRMLKRMMTLNEEKKIVDVNKETIKDGVPKVADELDDVVQEKKDDVEEKIEKVVEEKKDEEIKKDDIAEENKTDTIEEKSGDIELQTIQKSEEK